MKVLMSIKSEFADKIFKGEKKYEYRRVLFKNRDVTTVVVYASRGTKKVIGEFTIKEIITDGIDSLWKRTKDGACISEDFYRKYFDNKTTANAIAIGEVKKFKTPKELSDYNINSAPQSFCYIDKD